MRRLLTLSLTAALLAGTTVLSPLHSTSAWAAEKAPLLMEGKKTLYQRVLSRPGAVLKRQAGDGPGAQQAALTRFYVYSRQTVGGQVWLEVGLTAKGKTDGWLQESFTLPWKQQLTLAFTNPAGRDRALMFKERQDLAKILEAENPGAEEAPLLKAAEAGKPSPQVVSIEPATYVDIAQKFYLLPILDAEETFSGPGYRVRMLHIASVSAKDEKAEKAPAQASVLKNFRAAVVFVIDSTLSMDPYINRTRQAVEQITAKIDKAGLSSRVRFGLVAFRSNVQATPGLEYVSKLYADPEKAQDGKDFLQQVKDLKAATVSSAKYSEDSYAGVMEAINKVSWTDFGGRYVVLITDAGALHGNDPLSSTKLDAEQVRLEAQHRGVALYTLHLKSPSGKQNHAEAEAQYKALSAHPLLPQPLYYPVDAGAVDQFGKMVDTLSETIVAQVNAAYRGEEAVGSARTADPAFTKTEAKDDTARMKMDAAMLGHAMQLAYLGRSEKTSAPPMISAWLTDRDLKKPDMATTEVRVLLTKNQLSDMQQVLRSIAEAGQASQLSPNDFFARMRSAAVVLGRDPNAINDPKAVKLADLGLMGEYLDDLPYRSKVMDIDQEMWSSWSISQQQAFLDEVNRKLRLYQIYHDDVDRWVALDGGADPGEAVYPVPLDALP